MVKGLEPLEVLSTRVLMCTVHSGRLNKYDIEDWTWFMDHGW